MAARFRRALGERTILHHIRFFLFYKVLQKNMRTNRFLNKGRSSWSGGPLVCEVDPLWVTTERSRNSSAHLPPEKNIFFTLLWHLPEQNTPSTWALIRSLKSNEVKGRAAVFQQDWPEVFLAFCLRTPSQATDSPCMTNSGWNTVS